MAHSGAKAPKFAVALVVVAALVAATVWWLRTGQSTQADGSLSGVVEGTEYRVAPVMAGRIASITVSEGDAVEAGQVLVTLDAAPLKLQVDQAKAQERIARAKLKQAIDDGTDAEVDQARAELDVAKAGVALAIVQRGYAEIKAPKSGVVVAVSASEGENASPGKTLLAILDADERYARVYVTETRIGEVAVGDSVTVVAGGRDYSGSVNFVASEAEFTPNNVETEEQRAKLVYEVRVEVEAGAELKPGTPVDVRLQ